MFKYRNELCPYCNQPLEETDELAVCPECGTPHHRSCYLEHKCCANESKHTEGFEWQPTHPSTDTNTVNGKLCASCGTINRLESHFCEHCGQSFGESGIFENNSIFPDTPPESPEAIDVSIHAAMAKNIAIDGIPVRDWVTYISTSVAYYLYSFNMQDRSGKKLSFTWSAMMFPVLYFLYRKVWGIAAIAFVTNAVMRIPYIVATFLVPRGITLGISAAMWTSITNATSYLIWLVNLAWGLFAVYFYRKSSAKKIKNARNSSANEQEYKAKLLKISGPSYAALICAFAPYLVAFLIVFLFL